MNYTLHLGWSLQLEGEDRGLENISKNNNSKIVKIVQTTFITSNRIKLLPSIIKSHRAP
jgi:hypothetical protein